MGVFKFLAFFGLLATASAAPPSLPYKTSDKITPFELRKIVTTQYQKGDTSFSFHLSDPDSQIYGRCSTVWKSSDRPTAGWIPCTNEIFSFRYDDYDSLTDFDIAIIKGCDKDSQHGCKPEVASAGFVASDPNWRLQAGGNRTTSAYYKGILAVPVHAVQPTRPEKSDEKHDEKHDKKKPGEKPDEEHEEKHDEGHHE